MIRVPLEFFVTHSHGVTLTKQNKTAKWTKLPGCMDGSFPGECQGTTQ